MKLVAVQTINNRTYDVCKAVSDSFRLPGNQPDSMVIVLDRPTKEIENGAYKAYHDMPFKVVFIEAEETTGKKFPHKDNSWKGPAKAWNRAFQQRATESDLLYCFSSEVVQDEGNILKAKTLALTGEAAIFGSCHNSITKQLVIGDDTGLLVSSKMARPLGFIACIPTAKVRQIQGFDQEFMKGFWYDDDDFYLRLWQTGIPFVFYDSIHGIHLDHERPTLETTEGQKGIAINRAYMFQKHGTINPWPNLPRYEYRKEGKTIWKHPE
jgi:hypothetical protein